MTGSPEDETQMKKAVQSILQGIQSVETALCGAGLILTTLLIVAQVLNRYLLHFEIMWLNDAALYAFTFFMLVAAGYATFKEGHVAVDMFQKLVVRGRPRAAAVYRVCLVLLSILILCRFLPVAYQFMRRAVQYPEYGTLIRWFNTSWLQITVFVICLLVLLHLVVIAKRDIVELIRAFSGKGQKGRD
jgi:C4-dicarboxylate transporter DctQ subunit